MSTMSHITITTGHHRASPRSEVYDETLDLLEPLLRRVVAGETVAVPNVKPVCALTGAATGDALILTVWGPSTEDMGRIPLATVAVARGPDESERLWGLIHTTAVPPIGRPGAAPTAPWCAARIDPGLAYYPEASEWLGDLERCLAWAWIERLSQQRQRPGA